MVLPLLHSSGDRLTKPGDKLSAELKVSGCAGKFVIGDSDSQIFRQYTAGVLYASVSLIGERNDAKSSLARAASIRAVLRGL